MSADSNLDGFSHQLEIARARAVQIRTRLEASHPHGADEVPISFHGDADNLAHVALEELSIAHEELRVAEEELREQNAELERLLLATEAERRRYFDLFDLAPDGYLVTSIHGTIQDANKAAEMLLGLDREFLVGKPLILFMVPENRAELRLEMAQLKHIQRAEEWEVRMKPRQGEPFDALLRVTTIRDMNDTLVGYRWLIRDVTERKLAEHSIRRLNAELARRVDRRTAELEAANAHKDELLAAERAAREEAEDLQRKLALLARAGEELGASIDLETTLATVMRLVSPRLADWCLVDLIGPDCTVIRYADAPSDRSRQRLLAPGERQTLRHTDSLSTRVMLSQNPVAMALDPDAGIDEALLHETLSEGWCSPRAVERLGARSLVCLPLVARSQTIGSITLVYAEPGRRHIEEDVQLAQTLSTRFAMALDNAQLHTALQEEMAERRRVDTELHHSEWQMRKIFDSPLLSILYFDIEGKIVDANEQFLQMIGATREMVEAGSLRWIDLIPEDWRPRVAEAVQELRETGVGERDEYEYLRIDGTRFPVLVGGAMIDERLGVAFMLDITHQKELERELRERETSLRLAQRAGRVGTWRWVVGETGRWDANLADLFGYPSGAVVESLDEFFSNVHPDDRLHIVETIRAARDGVRPEFEAEFRVLLPDMTTRWIVTVGRASVEENGATVVAGACVDITDRKTSEEQLVVARDEAVSANQAKDRFLAMLSHELRTPLTPVVALTQMLREETTLDTELAETIALIHRNVEHEARLVDDMLELARIASGKLELRTEPVDLHELVMEVVESIHVELAEARMMVVVDLCAPRHQLMADRTRIRQVVWNLVRNALKYTPELGQITIATEDGGDGMIELTISDTGRGIERAAMTSIFNAFEQGGGRPAGGLGLGLTICRLLVESHGGTIRASSAGAGKGATFTVRLPATREG